MSALALLPKPLVVQPFDSSRVEHQSVEQTKDDARARYQISLAFATDQASPRLGETRA